MKKVLSLLFLSPMFAAALAAQSVKPYETTVGEFFENPVGFDLSGLSFSWKLPAARAGLAQTAYEIRVYDADGRSVWGSGKVESSQSVKVPYGGRPLLSREKFRWQVSIWDEKGHFSEWSDPAFFEVGLLSNSDWKADWIFTTQKPDIGVEKRFKGTKPRDCKISKLPPTYLRKGFSLGDEVKSARLYVSTRGNFQAFINGKKVGSDYWGTGWTDYFKRIQANTYDVTQMLKQGENAMGFVVGAGWYAGRLGWNLNACNYGEIPQLLAQLEVVYRDGRKEVFASDSTWKWSNGPITFSDIYDGEEYDARLEMPGWNDAKFDDSAWKPVGVEKLGTLPLIEPRRCPPIVQKDLMHAMSVEEISEGTFIFDLGQNMVGWARVAFPGLPGRKIKIRFAEMLNKDGTLYTENYRTARSQDFYICAGYGIQEWEPALTFHGFRYVELSGFPKGVKPTAEWVKGVVLYNDIPMTGSFMCSNPKVNKLQSNIQWGQRGNFFSVPTDCPQRDERLGWTGDAQVFVPTAAFNMNVDSFFTKWMVDVIDAQTEEGAYSDIAPARSFGKGGKPAWADAGAICPWEMYLAYADVKILKNCYPSIQRWIEYLKKNSQDYLRPDYGYGDWLRPNLKKLPDVPKTLIGTAYFVRSADIASEIARILGKNNDAKMYAELAKKVREAFVKKFVSEDGSVESGSQTAYLLALAFDILPENLRQKSFEKLLKAIETADWHLDTGFVGTPLLNPVLTRFGRMDVAYRLLNNESYPSWLYPINQGATTMWERWNSYSTENGFGNVDMNSFNHYAYGAIGQWLYKDVAGLWYDESVPGYKNIMFAPKPGGGLNFAAASKQTPYGMATSNWKISDGVMEWTVVIPPNSTGTIIFPTSKMKSIRINGLPVSESKFEKGAAKPTMKNAPSGTYQMLLRPDKI